MKKIKVAILNDVINEPYNALFRELAKSENYQFFVFYCFADKTDIREEMGFDFKVLEKWQLPAVKTELQLAVNPTILLELAKFNPEVIIIMGWDLLSYWLAFLFAKIFHKKIIIWSGSTKHEASLQRKLTLPFVKYLLHQVDACLVYGSLAYQYLLSLGVKSEKIFMAFNTVDTEFFKRMMLFIKTQGKNLKEKYGLEDKKIILFVGQLIERKGVFDLLKAVKILKKEKNGIVLLMAGDGPIKLRLQEYVKRNKLQKTVRFLGRVDYHTLPEIYSIADLFVLPSREEVWGLVINEAMICGLPIVTSDRVGAGADLVRQGENGFVVPAGNNKILSNCFNEILHHSSLAKKMGERSEELIKPFTNKNRARKFFIAINSALANK